MIRIRRSTALLVVPIAIALASCGGDADETPAPAATTVAADTMSEETMSEETMSEETMSEESLSEESMVETTSEGAMADLPLSQTLPITDVDGVTFTLHDLAGKPVFVEAFATWCPKCREQLVATNEAAATLGDSATVLALSVETDLAAADVAAYAADNGYDNVRFAVMSPELLAALVEEFGNSVANPPSTPKFVLDAMGHASELTTGPESADAIVTTVQSMQG